MTSLIVEQLPVPASGRDQRMLALIRGRADEALAGRTVWCLASGSAGCAAESAIACDRALHREGVDARVLTLQAGAQEPEQLIGPQVRGGDVVILHGALRAALAGSLANAVRASDAHAVWCLTTVTVASAPPGPGFDAYIVAWSRSGLAAFMPAPDLVSAKAEPPEFGWSSLLADVVREDHDEHVGGTVGPRPAVAVR